MKYFQIFTVLIIFLLQISVSQTKINKGFIATIGGGVSFPINDAPFKDKYDYGINIFGTGGFKFNKTYILRGGIHYNRFPYSEIGNGTGNLTYVVLNVELAAGAFNTKQKYHPYGVAGIGIYFNTSKLTLNGSTSTTTENDIGISAGVGIIIDLSKNIGVFAEAQYNYMFNHGTDKGFLPFKVGLSIAP